MATFRKKIKQWMWQLAARRAPRAAEVVLRHRTIYVLPSRAGWGFLLTVVILWLLGTNYQNNLVLGTSFLLLSLFSVSIIHAFRNLSGLRISAISSPPVFAGESVNFNIQLTPAPNSAHSALTLELVPHSHVQVDLSDKSVGLISISQPAEQRGWHRPDRLLISSRYPLGIVYAWSWVFVDTQVLVYPRPLMVSRTHSLLAEGDEELEGQQAVAGAMDDFQGFIRYQPGASPAQIAWKQYARGAGLHLKDYQATLADSRWLDYEQMRGEMEERLSGLCHLALTWQQQGRQFGLRLPTEEISPASGEPHLQAVLRALALYGKESS